MKFRINRDHFSQGLQQVMNLVGNRMSMPILGNVLIQTTDDGISLTTTNLDLGILCHVQAEIQKPGAITLPVRKLASIIRSLPNVQVEFAFSSNPTAANPNPALQASIVSAGSTFRMTGLAAEEFPGLTSVNEAQRYEVRQEPLAAMLKSISYAQSADENRVFLNGVYFVFDDGALTLVATDGRRLALNSMKADFSATSRFILPAKAVAELERLLGKGENVTIGVSDRHVFFNIDISTKEATPAGVFKSSLLVSKTVDGQYPNYRNVIPKEFNNRIPFERELVCQAIQRASYMASEKNHSVRLKFASNLLEISSSSAEYGEGIERVAIAYEGKEMTLTFNPTYLIDPMKALPFDELYFEVNDDRSPGVIKTIDNFLCVIMPLRLN